MTLAARCKLVLKRHGWNAGQWAKAAGLHRSHVYALLKPGRQKKPAYETLTKLARAANVSAQWLGEGTGSVHDLFEMVARKLHVLVSKKDLYNAHEAARRDASAEIIKLRQEIRREALLEVSAAINAEVRSQIAEVNVTEPDALDSYWMGVRTGCFIAAKAIVDRMLRGEK